MAEEQTSAPQGQSRLITHFQTRSIEDHGSGWSDLWDTGNSDLWDRGGPSPALIDVIEQLPELFNPWTPEGRRKKAFVPGCGKGYDVVMLALHGFDAYGLDISATGVSIAEECASTEMIHPQACNFGENTGAVQNPGNTYFIQGDFFKSDWESKVIESRDDKFDLIYDYTFLCALPPSLRSPWAERMSELLSSGGQLVCLEFPMYKDPALPGPPWGLKGVHWDLLSRGGNGIDNIGEVDKIEDLAQLKGNFVRTLYLNPPRSYPNGRGTDMLSVYSRK
ncbi:S-adenosyl-L-methionine-dependent methyltransferase [Lipomyces kononenkoae]|uniref:S-adenosyl-L-methionine-dependent methyltransferase n=1 Tax=Lipomyces kononenkoae TaxID=34357 RepID=A0ACC3T1N7_LIPKO